MVNWSFSRLSTYAACPKRYQLKYVDGHASEPTLPMLAGTAVHTAIEQWETVKANDRDGPGLTTLAQLHLAASPDLNTARVYGKKNIDYWISGGLEQMCDAWLEFRGDHPLAFAETQPLSVEYEVKWQGEGVEFVGYIDQLVEADGGDRLVVRDLKTGKPKDTHRVQLECYMASLPRELTARYERVSGEAVYLRDDGSYEIQTTEPTLTPYQLWEWLLEFSQAQVSHAFPATGRFTGACEWCDFRHLCPVSGVGETNVLL